MYETTYFKGSYIPKRLFADSHQSTRFLDHETVILALNWRLLYRSTVCHNFESSSLMVHLIYNTEIEFVLLYLFLL